MKWTRTLRFKFALAVTILLISSLAFLILLTLIRVVPSERRSTIDTTRGAAEFAVRPIVEAYATHGSTIGSRLTAAMRPMAQRLPRVEYYQIVDMNGAVLYDSRALKRSVVLEKITDSRALQAIQSTSPQEIITASAHILVFPYLDNQGGHPYSVQFVLDFTQLRSLSTALIWQSMLLALILLPIIYLLVAWFVRQQITRPIDQIRAEANAIASGNYSERIHLKQHDEIGALAQNINNMADLLTEQIDSLTEEKTWKNEFIVLAAHNLRTPLTVISSAINSLRKETGLSEEGKKFVDYIVSRSKELHTLVENLLSISLLKADRLKMSQTPFDLVQVLDKVGKEQETRLKEKNITLNLEKPEHQVIISGSEGQIFQVIDNLVDNALKFTPANGTITIRVEETSQDVNVAVQDSGPGIDEAMVSKLFQSFHRGSSPLSVENRGAGLGLYFVKLAVEAHGGEVSIKSQQGKGTEVSFRIPKSMPM